MTQKNDNSETEGRESNIKKNLTGTRKKKYEEIDWM